MWPFKKSAVKEKNDRSDEMIVNEADIEKMAKKCTEIRNHTNRQILFLCVGSDRSTGDSLGPLVGTMLQAEGIPFPVYGTLESPVHALNIKKVLSDIRGAFKNPFIIGVDACLGEKKSIGTVLIEEGSFVPGQACNKILPKVGDYHIKAIVNDYNPWSPLESLNSTRLYTVLKMADVLVALISRRIIE